MGFLIFLYVFLTGAVCAGFSVSVVHVAGMSALFALFTADGCTVLFALLTADCCAVLFVTAVRGLFATLVGWEGVLFACVGVILLAAVLVLFSGLPDHSKLCYV